MRTRLIHYAIYAVIISALLAAALADFTLPV